ncbi:alpha,alpha-trehalase nth1, partial [Tieghemiomyces parasiticus]
MQLRKRGADRHVLSTTEIRHAPVKVEPSTTPTKLSKRAKTAPVKPLDATPPKTKARKIKSETSDADVALDPAPATPVQDPAVNPQPAPDHWAEVYDRIKAYRAIHEAPVDTMGCERLADQTIADPKTYRFQTLVSLMLS